MNTKLILRTLASPFPSPYTDVTLGSVLSQENVDSNFIYLKGETIYSAETVGDIINLKKLNGQDVVLDLAPLAGQMITGGTYTASAGTATFTNVTGGTFDVTGFYTGATDVYITGVTYDISAGTATFTNVTGGTIDVNGFFTAADDTFVTGATFNDATGIATFVDTKGASFDLTGLFKTSDEIHLTGATFDDATGIATFVDNHDASFDLTGLFKTSDEIHLTGGTYTASAGTATFTDNHDASFDVTGFFTADDDVYVSDMTFNDVNYNLTITRNDGQSFTESFAILANDMNVTGGTYNPSNGIATFANNSGSTFNVTGFLTGYTDVRTSGATFDDNNGVATFTNTAGETFTLGGLFKTSDDVYVTGMTFSDVNNNLTITRNDGASYAANLGVLAEDIYTTGGTYNQNNGIIAFENNDGSIFNVGGLFTPSDDVYITGGTHLNGTTTFANTAGGTFNVDGYFSANDDIYVSGMSFNQANYDLTITRNDGQSFTESLAILATDMTITGGTYDSNTGVGTFTNNSGGTFDVSGFLTGFTDTFVTGGTYSNGVATFTNTVGSTFNVTGFNTGSDNYEFVKKSNTYYNLVDYVTFQIGNSSFTHSSGQMSLTPFFAKDDISIASLCMIIQSSNINGSLGKVSVYSSDPLTQLPDALITSTADLNIESNGTKEGILASTLNLVKGNLYYFGVSVNFNSNVCNYPYLDNGLKTIFAGLAGFQNTSYVGYTYYFSGGEDYSNLPATLNISNVSTTTGNQLGVVKYKAL